MSDTSQKEILKYLSYSEETGLFTWKVRRGRARKGDTAGTTDFAGYRHIRLNGKYHRAHRLAWIYVNGAIKHQKYIDHIDGNPSNNSISNLREVSQTENLQNSFKLRGTTKAGLIGITLDHNKWLARIRVNGTRLTIGRFDSKEEAHTAYVEAKLKLHPFWVAGNLTLAIKQ